MAAAAIRRNTQLLINAIAPVTKTYDEIIKEKLEMGKFPTTVTGIFKITGMLFLLFGISVFLAQPQCEDTSSWYPYVLPIVLGVTTGLQFIYFMIFTWGLSVKKPSFWIYSDIILILCLSVLSLVVAVVTFKECSVEGIMFKLPGPLSMVGSIILIISCGSIFLMYRYTESEIPSPPAPSSPTFRYVANEPTETAPRKSLFV